MCGLRWGLGRKTVLSERQRRRASSLALFGIWAGAVVAVASTLAWVASAIWTSFFMAQFGDSLSLRTGTVSYLWTTHEKRLEIISKTGYPLQRQWNWYCSPRQVPMEWWGGFTQIPGRAAIWAPLWPFTLAGGTVALLCWRRRRQVTRIGCCNTCGYALAGLPAGAPCPECGRGVGAAAALVPSVKIDG